MGKRLHNRPDLLSIETSPFNLEERVYNKLKPVKNAYLLGMFRSFWSPLEAYKPRTHKLRLDPLLPNSLVNIRYIIGHSIHRRIWAYIRLVSIVYMLQTSPLGSPLALFIVKMFLSTSFIESRSIAGFEILLYFYGYFYGFFLAF